VKPSNITDKIIPLSFAKKPFDTPCEKTPDGDDKLFQPWYDDIKAWALSKPPWKTGTTGFA